MKLLSINVSQPVEVVYEGKTVSTGIFKKPVRDPVFVTRYNLAGDKQVDLVNHGGEHKAVYAFSADQYGYWRKTLNRPDLSYGQFGENLTVSELDEASLHIGDRLQLGDCVLEITQPRVPCFKLGIAIGEKKMPRLFIRHFATGIYFRVIQEGVIRAGDELTRLSGGAHQVSVRNLFRAYYDKDFENPLEVLQRALEIPQLSYEWRDQVQAKVANMKKP